MAGFTMDAAKVAKLMETELSDLDEDSIEYLSGMVADCEEPGEEGEGIVELLAPFIESYGIADDEDAAEELAKKMTKMMIDQNILVFKNAAQKKQEEDKLSQKKLAMPIQASTLMEQDGGDTWGLNSVKVKHNANTIVDSISDALGDKKSLERQAKKAEKEKKKEEAKILREEQERQKQYEEMQKTPAPNQNQNTAKTQALRNRSPDVDIPNVNISVGGGKVLLEDANLKIVAGRKYGMIGRNGVGKSTLLNAISRRQLDNFPPYLSVVHVEQEVKSNDMLVIDYVLKADTERERLLKEEKELLAKLEENDADTSVNDKLRKLYDMMASVGVESAEARARGVLTGLGFSEEMQGFPTKSLSGGWRMRVALATALYLSPDILLLDEPTNHLDIRSVLFLEKYLQNYPKTLILVSHDRLFTNNIITDVINLENKQLQYYKGDIDVFEQTRENQRLQQQREYDSQQQKREHMQKFVDRFRYNAKRASMAQSRIKALNKMTLVEEVVDDPEFKLDFPEPVSELNKVIEVQDVSFGYPVETGEPKLLFQNVEFSVFTNSRIALLGPNGCGKSSLLKVIMDHQQPTKGYVQREPKLRIGYFSQHHVDQLDLRQTSLDYLLQTFHGSKIEEVRSHLSRYGIPAELASQRIGTLSGGQKSRVALAKITWDKPHLLILDEITNHLDLQVSAALVIALNTFSGGVLMVTHDQYLIEMCAEEIWIMEDGKVWPFKGTLEEYKKWAMPDDF